MRYNSAQGQIAALQADLEAIRSQKDALDASFLERSGAEALPLVLLDGEVALAGRYPARAEVARWLGVADGDAAPDAPKPCCSGSKCC